MKNVQFIQHFFHSFDTPSAIKIYCWHCANLCITGDQGANKVRPLIIQYQDIMQSFEQADNELSLLKENLEGKQVSFCFKLLAGVPYAK